MKRISPSGPAAKSADGVPTSAPVDTVYAQRWKALWVLALGLAMIVIDGTIVGVALPDIIEKLHLSITDAQWVNSLYSVVFAALLLSTGRLADRIGRRTTFMTGVVLFAVGSVMAALSGSVSALILARLVQGVGGAVMLPSTLSSVNAMFQGPARAAAFGVWGAVMSGAAALGPLLGGWLTSTWSWEWIFWVNVPIAFAVAVGTVLWVPQTRGDSQRRGMDVDGFLTSALGFGGVVFGIIEGPTLGWFRPISDLQIGAQVWSTQAPVSAAFVALVLGIVFLALFIVWERHRAGNGRDAILNVQLFHVPTFTWGNVAAFAVAVGEFCVVFMLPLFLVNVLGLTEMHAGFVLAAMALGAFGSGAAARHVAAAIGAPWTVVVGLALEVVGMSLVAVVVSATVSPWLVGGLLIIYGLGLGLASAQLTSLVLRDVPPADSGQGSATQSTTRQVGAAVGAAVAGAVLSASLAHTLPTQLAATHIPAPEATHLASVMHDSAGSMLPAFRSANPANAPVADALAQGFAVSTRYALLSAVVFLLLGLLAALRVRRAAQSMDPNLQS
ncbi:MFS transporter [Corynebacterium sp. 13CS0277]|uniref:MFS transporter n=1 Tax=Corynebacterium sp. 13CS0277 TaxID=2071994 RepID=UPI000D03574D|nr:MFS transporter [Corynebacterium sp. 13CS0277]PRQ10837.1 MFS transporter [Corynebacterium sp. 13CS0277]